MTHGLQNFLAHLRRAVPPQGAPTDGQLLARFVDSCDEAAFTDLLRRHGPLVLSVCRRLARHEQDAEDAFQATFLVLVKKAGSVAGRDSVGGWLHGVAFRAALKAREATARRRERQADEGPDVEAPPEEAHDWQALHEELDRLPEKYREPLVLCYLEGRSRREAAARLCLPEGTLSSRLATARQMLGQRLVRRGIALS